MNCFGFRFFEVDAEEIKPMVITGKANRELVVDFCDDFAAIISVKVYDFDFFVAIFDLLKFFIGLIIS